MLTPGGTKADSSGEPAGASIIGQGAGGARRPCSSAAVAPEVGWPWRTLSVKPRGVGGAASSRVTGPALPQR